jgi:hypothetical protein
MYREIKIGKRGNVWLHYGYSHMRLALGITISPNNFELDLVFFWIGLEW